MSVQRVERLERALSGALRFGDRQADELARLSQLTARQKRTLWRALALIKQGRHEDAIVALEAECPELRDQGPARKNADELEQWWRRKRGLDDPGGAA